eukprot:jgi/Psemu1/53729/gm1.53729_g
MTSQLGVNPLSSVDSLVLSDYNSDLGSRLCAEPPATATFVATDTAFTDKINYFGDPMVRTIVLLFGVVFLLLAGLTVLSKKMDAAIENVLVDFEEVMTSSPEFRDQWEEIELQLKFYDDEVETSQLRKQKMFEIMEELEEKEPMFMKRFLRLERHQLTMKTNERILEVEYLVLNQGNDTGIHISPSLTGHELSSTGHTNSGFAAPVGPHIEAPFRLDYRRVKLNGALAHFPSEFLTASNGDH